MFSFQKDQPQKKIPAWSTSKKTNGLCIEQLHRTTDFFVQSNFLPSTQSDVHAGTALLMSTNLQDQENMDEDPALGNSRSKISLINFAQFRLLACFRNILYSLICSREFDYLQNLPK